MNRVSKYFVILLLTFVFCVNTIKAQTFFNNKGKVITITSGAKFSITGSAINEGSIKNEGRLSVGGDWTNLSSYLSEGGTFVLNGTTVQQVNHGGQTFYVLELMGGGRKIFTSDVSVINSLILASGIAEVSATKTFLLREGSQVTGGSDASFIEGIVYRSGTGDLIFPTGSNGTYAPVELLDVTGNSPVIGFQVREPNPASTAGFGLTDISEERYWQQELLSGTFTDAQVKLSSKEETLFSGLTNAVVAASNTLGGEFESLGQSSASGDESDGRVTSSERGNSNFYALGSELNESRLADSLALVSLFNNNGGISWGRSNNWLVSGQLIDNWEGVLVDGAGRVEGLSLSDNNLIGILTNQLRLMDALKTIDLSKNKLTSVPDLSGLPNLTDLDISENSLLFSSIVPNVGFLNFNYTPQDSVGTGGVSLENSGVDKLLSFPIDDLNNSYQWYLNGVAIPTGTDREYLINNLNRSNMGSYYCEITNSAVSGLTLLKRVNTVLAIARISGSTRISDAELLTAGDIKLLRVKSGAYDTLLVKPLAQNGLYTFENVVLADYILITEPFEMDKYLPTYHEQSIQWDLASVIELNNDTTGIDIQVELKPEDPTPEEGNGLVSGDIFTDFPEEGRIEARRRVRRVGVALRRRRGQGRPGESREAENDPFEGFDLIGYTTTDDEGKFSFGNLPTGTYRIFIEYPGIPISADSFTEFEIGEGSNDSEVLLTATVFEDEIVIEEVEVADVPKDYIDELTVYPNPVVDNELFVKVSARNSYQLEVELTDLRGVSVMKELINNENLGNGVRKLNVSNLTSGIYLIRITTPSYGNQLYKVGKIIISER